MPTKAVNNFDFHCHSRVSDGLFSPSELADRASLNGVDFWALTDHDDLRGIPEAREAAAKNALRFTSGVEISTEWRGKSVHIVGLGFSDDAPNLQAGLKHIRDGRTDRAQKMSDALAAIGIPHVLEGALSYAENPELISRAHFARHMVTEGIGRDTAEIFQHYLVPGKPGYVEHVWPRLEEAVLWITSAGGVAVIAHPGRYGFSGEETRHFLDDFKAYGGQGIEVACGSHTPDHIRHFARLARHYAFYASRGSDFHDPNAYQSELGHISPLPPDLKPVWLLLNDI